MKNVVVFKIPIQVSSSSSYRDMFIEASRMCEQIYGFRPSPFTAEIFEVDDESQKLIKYYNPTIEYGKDK